MSYAKQTSLFPELAVLADSPKPVNVASVPQRSPFRYPGGKTWLVPYIREWPRTVGPEIELIEPFAGGGNVSLTAGFEDLAKSIVMVEKDEDVAAVWRTILGSQGMVSTANRQFPCYRRKRQSFS